MTLNRRVSHPISCYFFIYNICPNYIFRMLHDTLLLLCEVNIYPAPNRKNIYFVGFGSNQCCMFE